MKLSLSVFYTFISKVDKTVYFMKGFCIWHLKVI